MMDKKVLADLIQACQKGNEKAQSTFYMHYKRKLLGICRRYARTTFEAEDIFQDAFIKVFLKIGDVTHPEAIDYWIKSIVVRTAIDHYRKNSPFWFTQDIEKPGILPDDTDPFDVLDALEKEEIMAVKQSTTSKAAAVTIVSSLPDDINDSSRATTDSSQWANNNNKVRVVSSSASSTTSVTSDDSSLVDDTVLTSSTTTSTGIYGNAYHR